MKRRVVTKSATAAAKSTVAHSGHTAKPSLVKRAESAEMIYRELGTTGERVSAIGLGGFHLAKDPQTTQKDAIKLVRSAVDAGITFMDNCWDYNDGISEVRMGWALKDGYREKVFLMTKLDARTGGGLGQAA